jgi:hypothetical protein
MIANSAFSLVFSPCPPCYLPPKSARAAQIYFRSFFGHGTTRNRTEKIQGKLWHTTLALFREISVRQGKFVRSRKRKGACHVNCPFDIVAERACLGVIQGAKPREAKVRAARIEPVSASLHQLKVASLPELLKPVTDQEATGICTGRAFRGERGRRVSKDLTGTTTVRLTLRVFDATSAVTMS